MILSDFRNIPSLARFENMKGLSVKMLINRQPEIIHASWIEASPEQAA
jgi:hypothetical protein